MTDLSAIIISYNTKDITQKCLDHLVASLSLSKKISAQIIVVDNGSSDGSREMLKKFTVKNKNINYQMLDLKKNLGFSAANNAAAQKSTGRYLLFLNSDAYVRNIHFEDLIYYMDNNPTVGALTVKIELENGRIDPASHRGIPTVWRAFAYFSKLEKIFRPVPKLSKLFGGYHLSHLDLETIHEIDSPSGAFYFTRAALFKKIGGFDTRFFMYGEDLDLSKRIKKQGYKIMYYPLFKATHLKYQSGLKSKNPTGSKTRKHFYEAMKIFYDKHYSPSSNKFANKIVHFFIDLKSKF